MKTLTFMSIIIFFNFALINSLYNDNDFFKIEASGKKYICCKDYYTLPLYFRLSDINNEIQKMKKEVTPEEFEKLIAAVAMIRHHDTSSSRWELPEYEKEVKKEFKLYEMDNLFSRLQEKTKTTSDEGALQKFVNESYNDKEENHNFFHQAYDIYGFKIPIYHKLDDVYQKVCKIKEKFKKKVSPEEFNPLLIQICSDISPLILDPRMRICEFSHEDSVYEKFKSDQTVNNFYSLLKEKTKETTNEGALQKFLNGSC